MAEIRFSTNEPIALGERRAKQSQDDKPLTHQEPVRTASVDHSPWSHVSLRSRRGMKVSSTRPLLPRLSFAPHIPARPFGLGSRSDVAPSVPEPLMRVFRARRIKPRSRKHRRASMTRNHLQARPIRRIYRTAAAVEPLPVAAVSRTQSSPGALQARAGAFARSGHAEPISLSGSHRIGE